MSTAHVGLQLDTVISQAARVGHELYILWVDLATFFPSVERRCLTLVELRAGIPHDLLRIVALIFGTSVGFVPEDLLRLWGVETEGIECRYDSADGLGGPFSNDMGALMGDVLSPDRSKCFVNSVLAAIHVVVVGVRLWGSAPKTADEVWHALSHAAFADDVFGAFTRETEIQLAWSYLSTWSLIFGQELGVKRLKKTVVSGVRWVGGKAVATADPKLPLPGGQGFVPMMGPHDAYKHVGVWKRLDGSWVSARKDFDSKVGWQVGRLAGVKYASRKEFCMLADVLLGGSGHFYLQTWALTWAHADGLEGRFRALLARKYGRTQSAARFPLYASTNSRRPLRKHLWAIGPAALFATVFECVSEPVDSQQRRAARSALAVSLYRWGCRSSPLKWDFEHLRGVLEAQLAARGPKHYGDAFMLAALLIDDWYGRDADGRRPVGVGSLRLVQLLDFAANDPLHEGYGKWCGTAGTAVFESAGCGVAPQPRLLELGFVEVGHFCTNDGSGGIRFLASYAEAVAVHGLTRDFATRLEFDHAVVLLRRASVAAEPPLALMPLTLGWEEAPFVPPIDEEALARLDVLHQRLGKAKDADKRGVAAEGDLEAWRSRLQHGLPGFPMGSAPSRPECDTGIPSVGDADSSVVIAYERDGEVRRFGGRVSFARDRACDDEGWVAGWQDNAASTMFGVEVDNEATFIDCDSRQPLTASEAAESGIAMEMYTRARTAAGEATVVHEVLTEKTKEAVVSYPESCAMAWKLTEAVAKVDAQAVFTLDGMRGKVTSPSGSSRTVAAWACCAHDGEVAGGVLEGGDNFTAEIAAQMHVPLECEARGVSRAVIVFDATSPVEALFKYARLPYRKRQRHYMRRYLDTWLQRLRRMEAVYLLWQPSHKGEVVNDYADKMVGALAEQGDDADPALLPPTYGSLELCGAREGARAWALEALAGLAVERLAATSTLAAYWSASDIVVEDLPAAYDFLAGAVLDGRCQACDPGRYNSFFAVSAAAEAGCPFGCGCSFTWVDVQFYCMGPPLVALRKRWARSLVRAAGKFSRKELFSHPDLAETATRCQLVQLPPSAPRVFRKLSVDEAESRRFACIVAGRVPAMGGAADTKSSTLEALRTMTLEGLELQKVAKEWNGDLEKRIEAEVKQLTIARPLARKWRLAVVEGGPARASMLREVAMAAKVARGYRAHMARVRPLTCDYDWMLRCHARLRDTVRLVAQPLARAERSETLWDALVEWLLLALVRQWRAYAASRPLTGGPRRREVTLDSSLLTDIVLSAAADGLPYDEPIYRASAEGGRSVLGTFASLSERVECAQRMYHLGGGRAAERKLVGFGTNAGRICDGKGRWAVECVLDVRYPVPRIGPQLDVLVRWKGAPIASKTRWCDGWISVTLLSDDLKAVARGLERQKLKRPAPPSPVGDRVNPAREARPLRKRRVQVADRQGLRWVTVLERR